MYVFTRVDSNRTAEQLSSEASQSSGTPIWLTILIALGTLTMSGIALRLGRRANKHAGVSAQAAVQSAAEAKRAADASEASAGAASRSADVAERAEVRQTERDDVAWTAGFDEAGTWAVTNLGIDDALKVTVIVVAGDDRFVEKREIVPSRGEVVVDLTSEVERVKRETDTRNRQAHPGGRLVYVESPFLPTLTRILWQSAAGAWRDEVVDSGEVQL